MVLDVPKDPDIGEEPIRPSWGCEWVVFKLLSCQLLAVAVGGEVLSMVECVESDTGCG